MTWRIMQLSWEKNRSWRLLLKSYLLYFISTKTIYNQASFLADTIQSKDFPSSKFQKEEPASNEITQ